MPAGRSPRLTWTHLFAVRPSFTLGALKLLWFAILIREALAYTALVARVLRVEQGDVLIQVALIDGAIQALGRIVLLRLVLEIAATVLLRIATPDGGFGSRARKWRAVPPALLDFFAFRPVFTAICLKIVWVVYLAFTLIAYVGTIKQLLDAEPGLIMAAWASVLTGLISP